MRPFGRVQNPSFAAVPGQNRNAPASWNWKGHDFPLHSYAQPWSLQIDEEADIYRAEVRQGENAYFDDRSPATRDRAEISWETPFAFGIDMWLAGFLWVVPLDGTISGLSQEPIVFQWHDTGDAGDAGGMAPPVALVFTRTNTLRLQWAYNLDDPFVTAANTVAGSVTVGACIPGRWVNVVMRVKMNQDALNGEIDVWLDGVLAGSGSTYRGNLGTPNVLGPYWKAGIYRYTDAVPMAIAWQGLTVSTDSLVNRKDAAKPSLRL